MAAIQEFTANKEAAPEASFRSSRGNRLYSLNEGPRGLQNVNLPINWMLRGPPTPK